MTINYSIRLQILFFWGREIYLEIGTRLQFSTRRKCLFGDQERSSRRPSLSPLFTSSKQYSILLPVIHEREKYRAGKSERKERKGKLLLLLLLFRKIARQFDALKGKRGNFFFSIKFSLTIAGQLRAGQKKKRPLTIHDNRFLSATVRAVQPLPSPFNGKGTPSTVTSTLVTALVTGRIGRHQRLKESI